MGNQIGKIHGLPNTWVTEYMGNRIGTKVNLDGINQTFFQNFPSFCPDRRIRGNSFLDKKVCFD